MVNHWNDNGDLVIEEKTLFRQVGWLGHSGNARRFYGMALDVTWIHQHEPGGYSPVYEQIATWDGEGWRD